jgi:hypothetical protein
VATNTTSKGGYVEGRRAATKDGKFVVADTAGAVREILLTELSEDPLHLGRICVATDHHKPGAAG